MLYCSKVIAQINPSELLEERALAIYSQGLYPNVSQAFTSFDDLSINADQMERMDFYKMASALRLNEMSAEKMIENFRFDYPESQFYKTVYFDVANHYFNNNLQ